MCRLQKLSTQATRKQVRGRAVQRWGSMRGDSPAARTGGATGLSGCKQQDGVSAKFSVEESPQQI